jgi:hypothetical protein
MASGNTLLTLSARSCSLPATSYAELTSLTGGATPGERIILANFDDTTDEYIDLPDLVMPRAYAGGGLTLTIRWMAASATTGNVIWGAAFRRDQDDAEDWDTTAHSYDFNASSGVAAPSAVGETSYDTITFADGADMDSVAAGEGFCLRIRRDADNGSDTMTGDARFWTIEIKET